MLLSPFAHHARAQLRRHDREREVQAQRARSIDGRVIAACCATDATPAGTVDAAGSRRPLRPRAWLARRTFARAGA